MADSKVLAPFYYLKNFHYLLSFVESKSGAILSASESDFIINFRSLPRPAQALYVRMFNRCSLFFNVRKFNYPEIRSVKNAVSKLMEENFISTLICEEVDELSSCFKIFTKEELYHIYNCYTDKRTKSTIKRIELIGEILTFEPFQLVEIINRHFYIIKQERSEEAEMIRFLFFGSADYDMTEFVIRDIGNAEFENYDEKKLSSYFTSRKEVDDKWKITKIYKQFKEKKNDESPAIIYDWFKGHQLADLAETAQPIYNKLVTKLAYHLERSSLVEEALEVYSYTSQHPSRERRIRILSKQNKTEEAIELCNQILNCSAEPKEKIFALDFLNRKGQAYRQSTKELNNAEVIEIPTEFAGSVEQGAMRYFAERGYNSFFSENYIWRTLFGLLFWEIIYDIDAGALHNPLQRAPSDFYSPAFIEKRRARFENSICLLNNKAELKCKITKTWKEKYGKLNPLFGWDQLQIKMLTQLIKFVKPEQIHKVLQEMFKNLKSNSTGFPDLFVYNKSEYLFVEIKSPNDHLSDQQLFWMHFFEEVNINIKLLRVKWC